ncbi:HEAT repeat domain-containing protein [Rhizorhabdus sp. FW153]|uniref:HEAT repeat domain-containing protein n=1 Tax=Rhizorhabdus sp. FW153 TaxID=3400216 RepID=UPI003CE86B86
MAELFEAACRSDDEAAWDAIAALHYRGSRDVLDRALLLICSPDPKHRARAADILGQLGIPDRSFPDEGFAAVLPLLEDEALPVMSAAIYSLQHIDEERATPHILPFADHADGGIRLAVAQALGTVDTSASQHALLKLMSDVDPDVRNWATLGIGQLSEADTDEIREALNARLADDDGDVRYEAIIGLARRRDLRSLGYLKTMLHEEPDDDAIRWAAAMLLGIDNRDDVTTSDLLGGLQRLQLWNKRR